MSDTLPVSIGGMQLIGAEVPAFFDRGGMLKTVTIQTISGNRVIQVIGNTPAQRVLSGIFLGPAAVDRAQQLSTMRDLAIPVVLSIGIWTEYVLITNVTLRYADKGAVIQYTIQAETLIDPQQAIAVTTATIVGSVISDLAEGSSILAAADNQAYVAVLPQISEAQTSVASSFAGGNQVGADLDTPSTAMMGVIGTQASVIDGVSARAPTASVVGSSADLLQAVQSTATLATVVQAAGYVNRAGMNVASLNGTVGLPNIHS